MRSASAQLFTLALWAQTSAATGAPGASTGVRLEVSPDLGCVSEVELVQRVHARNPRIHFVKDNSVRVIRVTFSKNRSGMISGEITLLESTKTTRMRQLVADSCEDAADGTALILAVALDPTANDVAIESRTPNAAPRSKPPPAAKPQPDLTPILAPSAEPSSPTPSDSPASAATFPKPIPSSANSQPNPTRKINTATPPALSERWFAGAGLAGELTSGPAPTMMPGVAAYVAFGWQRASHWSPSLTLGGSHAWSTTVKEAEGDATFELTVLTLDVCPVRYGEDVWELRACGCALGGRLSAAASNTLNSRGTVARPFAAVGALGSLHYRPVPRLELISRVASRVNLVRDEFEFTPRVFHTVDLLTLTFSVAAGFRWQ